MDEKLSRDLRRRQQLWKHDISGHWYPLVLLSKAERTEDIIVILIVNRGVSWKESLECIAEGEV